MKRSGKKLIHAISRVSLCHWITQTHKFTFFLRSDKGSANRRREFIRQFHRRIWEQGGVTRFYFYSPTQRWHQMLRHIYRSWIIRVADLNNLRHVGCCWKTWFTIWAELLFDIVEADLWSFAPSVTQNCEKWHTLNPFGHRKNIILAIPVKMERKSCRRPHF